MNPNNVKDFKRLTEAVIRDYKQGLEPFRSKRKELIELSCGSEYSDKVNMKKKTDYLNLLRLVTDTYIKQLASKAPTAKITTPFRELRPLAADLSIACDEVAREVNLGNVLRRAAMEALYSPLAVVKMGLEVIGKDKIGQEDVDVTAPFVKNVSFDDYVRDMSARSAYSPLYEGDKYIITIEEFKKLFPGEKVKKEGEDIENINERAEGISHLNDSPKEGLKDKIELYDIWLTEERVLVTFRADNPGEKPLRVVGDYDIMEDGPYKILYFSDVLDNALPYPPFAALKNLHTLANNLYRRMAFQAQNKKDLVGFTGEDSAKKFQKAKDGDGILYSGQKPEKLSAGGIDQMTSMMFLQTKDLFSWHANNLDSLAGLSPMAETAKQDQLLAQSASAQIADMQETISLFAEDIFRQLAWYEWTDPIRERVLTKGVPGTDIEVVVPWTPETREGDFLDFNFQINPQSMRDDAAGSKSQRLIQVLTQIINPLMPIMQQQGLTINMKRLLEVLADYNNIPELEQITTMMDEDMFNLVNQPKGNSEPGVGKPSETHRTYERVNRSGATRVGKDMSLMQTLAGGNVQKSEREAMMGSVS